MKSSKLLSNSPFRFFTLFLLLTAFISFSGQAGISKLTENPPEEEVLRPELPFEDEQLLAFYDVNQEISALQRETQENIVSVLEENGLTMERFTQIGNAARIGALDGGVYSQDEINAFNTVAPRVTSIQRDMQAMMQSLIAEKGLNTQLYQDILTQFRQNQALQEWTIGLVRERAIEAAREERRRQREAEEAAQQPTGGE